MSEVVVPGIIVGPDGEAQYHYHAVAGEIPLYRIPGAETDYAYIDGNIFLAVATLGDQPKGLINDVIYY
jgi:hypothetical protein